MGPFLQNDMLLLNVRLGIIVCPNKHIKSSDNKTTRVVDKQPESQIKFHLWFITTMKNVIVFYLACVKNAGKPRNSLCSLLCKYDYKSNNNFL